MTLRELSSSFLSYLSQNQNFISVLMQYEELQALAAMALGRFCSKTNTRLILVLVHRHQAKIHLFVNAEVNDAVNLPMKIQPFTTTVLRKIPPKIQIHNPEKADHLSQTLTSQQNMPRNG